MKRVMLPWLGSNVFVQLIVADGFHGGAPFWLNANANAVRLYQLPGTAENGKTFLNLNPFTHLAISYQEILFYPGNFGHWKWLVALGVASVALFLVGYYLFDRLRDTFAEEV